MALADSTIRMSGGRSAVRRAAKAGVRKAGSKFARQRNEKMHLGERQRSVLVIAFAAATISLCCQQTCLAQNIPHYTPKKPTLSPYLGLTFTNFGGVPNYYAFVRPRQQQQTINAQQEALNAQQESLTEKHGAAIEKLDSGQQAVLGGAVPIAKTGTGSWFMTGSQKTYLDTSEFYPKPTARRPAR